MEIDDAHAFLRRDAREAEYEASEKIRAVGAGRRREIFEIARSWHPHGITSKNIERELMVLHPCSDCGCKHRPYMPVNQIASRLQELREWGFLAWLIDPETHKIVTRGGAEVHVLTDKGLAEPHS